MTTYNGNNNQNGPMDPVQGVGNAVENAPLSDQERGQDPLLTSDTVEINPNAEAVLGGFGAPPVNFENSTATHYVHYDLSDAEALDNSTYKPGVGFVNSLVCTELYSDLPYRSDVEVIASLGHKTLVIVENERVGIDGLYHFVSVVDSNQQNDGKTGYVHIDYCRKLPGTKPSLLMNFDCREDRFVVEDVCNITTPKWHETQEPYLDRQTCDYIINFTTEYRDTGDDELLARMQSAIPGATIELLRYYDKQYDDDSLENMLYNSFQFAKATSWYLNPNRERSRLQVLVAIPAKYIDAMPSTYVDLNNFDLSAETQAATTIDLDVFQNHVDVLIDLMLKFHQNIRWQKAKSSYSGPAPSYGEYDFAEEARKVRSFAAGIRSFVEVNGFLMRDDLGDTLEIGFTGVEEDDWRVTYIILNNSSGSHVLRVGFERLLQKHPFNDTRTLNYIFNLFEIASQISKYKELPGGFKEFFDSYVLPPLDIDVSSSGSRNANAGASGGTSSKCKPTQGDPLKCLSKNLRELMDSHLDHVGDRFKCESVPSSKRFSLFQESDSVYDSMESGKLDDFKNKFAAYKIPETVKLEVDDLVKFGGIPQIGLASAGAADFAGDPFLEEFAASFQDFNKPSSQTARILEGNQKATSLNKKVGELNLDLIDKFAFLPEIAALLNEEDPSTKVQRIDQKQREITMQVSANRGRREAILKAIKVKFSGFTSTTPGNSGADPGDKTILTVTPQAARTPSPDMRESEAEQRAEDRANSQLAEEDRVAEDLRQKREILGPENPTADEVNENFDAVLKATSKKKRRVRKTKSAKRRDLVGSSTAWNSDYDAGAQRSEVLVQQRAQQDERLASRVDQLRSHALKPYTIVLQQEPDATNIENLLFGNPESAMRAGGQAVFKKFLLEVSRGFDLGTALKRVINCLCTEISEAQFRARRIEDPVARNAALASLQSFSLAVGCDNICGAVPLLCSCLGFPAFPPKFNLPDSLSIKFGDIMYGLGVLITNTIITQIMQIVIQFIITMLNKLTACERNSDSQKLFIDRFRLVEQEGLGNVSPIDISDAFEDSGIPLGFSDEDDISSVNSLARETVLILTPREFCNLINGNAKIQTIELVEALMVESYPKLRAVFSNAEKTKLLYITIGQLIGPSLCRSLVDLFDAMPFEPSNYICDETNLRGDLLQGRATSEQIQEQITNALKCDADKVTSVISLIQSFSEGDNVADKIMPPILQTPDNPNGIIPREPESVKYISTKARTTLLQSVRDSFYSEANQNVPLLVTSKNDIDQGASEQETADLFANSFFSGGQTASPLGALVSMMKDSGKLTGDANNSVMQSVISNMTNGPFAGGLSSTGRSIAGEFKLRLQDTDNTIISFPRTSEETSFLGSDLISIELPISKMSYEARSPIAGSLDNYMTPFATPQWDRIPHYEEHPRIVYNLCISSGDSLDIRHARDVYSIELEDLKFPANDRTIFSFDGEKKLPDSVVNVVEARSADLGLHPAVSSLLSTPQLVFSNYVMDKWSEVDASLSAGPISELARGNHFVRYHSDVLFKTTSEDLLKGLARRIANSRFLRGDFQQNYDELSNVNFVLSPECSLDSFGLLGIAEVHDKISRVYDEDPNMDYSERYVNAMSLGIAIIFVRVVIVEMMLNSVFVFSEFKATDIFKSDMIANYALGMIKDELQAADSKYAHSSKDGTFFRQVMGRIASDIRRRKINKENFKNPITGEQVSVMLPLAGFVDAPGSPGSLLDVGFFKSGNQNYNRQQSVRKCRQANFTQASNNEDDCVPQSPEASNHERSDGSVDPNSGTKRLGFMEFFILEQLHQLGEKIEGILGAPPLDIDDIILGEYAKEINIPEYPGALRFTKPISAFVRLSADTLDVQASDVYAQVSDDEFVPEVGQDLSLNPLKDATIELLQQKIDELKDLSLSEKFKDEFLHLLDGGFILEKYIRIEDFDTDEWGGQIDLLNLTTEQANVIDTKIIGRSENLHGMVNINVWTDWFNQLLIDEAASLSFIYDIDDNGATVIDFSKLFKSWSFGSRLVMVYPFENLADETPIPYLRNLESARGRFLENLDLSEASRLQKAYNLAEISNIDVDLLPTDVTTNDPVQAGINLQNLLFNGDPQYASLVESTSQTFKYNTLPIITKETRITKDDLNMVPIFGSVEEILDDLKSGLNSIFLSNIRARYNELRIQFNNILFPALNAGEPGLPYPVSEDGTRNVDSNDAEIRIVDGTLYMFREKTAIADASFPWNGATLPEQIVDVNYDGASMWYSGHTTNGGEGGGALGSAFDAIAFTEGYPNSVSSQSAFNLSGFPIPGYWDEVDPITNNRMSPLNVGRNGVPQQGENSSVTQFKEMVAASGLDPAGGDDKLFAAFDRMSKVEGWRDSDADLRRNSAAGSLLYVSKYLLGFSPIHSYWGKYSSELQVLESIDVGDSWIWGYPRSFLGLTDSSSRTIDSIQGRNRNRREVETLQEVDLNKDTIGGRLNNIEWEIPEQAIATFRVPEDPLTGQHPLFREWYIGGPDATGQERSDGKIWDLLVDKFNPDYFPNDDAREMSSAIVEHSQNGVSTLEYNYLVFAEKMGSLSRGLFDIERGVKYVYDSLRILESRIEEMQEVVREANIQTLETMPTAARESFIQIMNDLEGLYGGQISAKDRTNVSPAERCFVAGEGTERKGGNECYRYDVLYDNMLKVKYYKNIVEGNTTSQLDDFNNIFNRVFRSKLHSEIKLDDGYQAMFQYVFPTSRFLSLLTIYNNEYVSRLPGRKHMFDQTKRILFNMNFDLAGLLEEKWWKKEPQRMPDWWQDGLQIGPPLIYILAPFVILEALISLVPPLKWLLGMPALGSFIDIDVSSWIKFPDRNNSGDPCETPPGEEESEYGV